MVGGAPHVTRDRDSVPRTQGDVWDTQWDMFLALVGSIVAQLALSRLYNDNSTK